MTAFRTAHAVHSDWRTAVARVASSLGNGDPAIPALGFIYVTDHFVDAFAEIIADVRKATGVQDWVGSVGLGILADAEELNDQPAIAAAVLHLPADGWRLVADTGLRLTGNGWGTYPVGIVHADPGNGDTPRQLTDLAERTGAFLVGGLASSRRDLPPAPAPFTGSAVSGVLLRDDVPIQIGLSQGCTPLGPVHRITEERHQVIMTLDGRPALDVFNEDIGERLARDPGRLGDYVHAALPIEDSDCADYLVRNLIGIDPMRRWLAIGADIAAGDRVMFVRRDPGSAREDLNRMLSHLARRLDEPPRGALYFSCVARGENMFGEAGAELAMIRRSIGTVPLLGFACGGEICNGRLYGYTGVLAVFS
ncbi:MAG: FIST C-terminal domain-containing protein [Rhodospirillales bacterium]